MRLLVLACVTLPLSASPAEPVRPLIEPESKFRFLEASPDKLCPKSLYHRDSPRPRAEMKRLGELPPADAYHAVYRRGPDGCVDPLLVGYQSRQGR